MQIHISQTTKDHLEHEPYIIEERGKIFVKVLQYIIIIPNIFIVIINNVMHIKTSKTMYTNETFFF